MSKVSQTEVEHLVVLDTNGEVVADNTICKTKLYKTEAEPEFVKLYINDISMLNKLSGTEYGVLLKLVSYIEYRTNEVYINKHRRLEVAEKLKCNDQTIKNTITKLVKRKIFTRIGTGMYRANPMIFGKGSWRDIKGLRVTIDYTEEGRNVQVKEIERDTTSSKDKFKIIK